MNRLFVTGAGGFVGRHLAAAIKQGEFGRCELFPAAATLDVRDADAVRQAVAEVRPDAVIHLAARSFVPESFTDPQGTFEVNLFGTLNLLQALKATEFRGRMLFVSSGDVYGRVPDDALPVTEARLPEPRSPYAVSKLSAELLCAQWHRSEGLDVIIARPFNHIGPGQNEQFVVPALASQVASIAAGQQPAIIDAGDIDVTRDFTDVRDVVKAYAALLQHGRAGETYLIGSGRERGVRELLQMLMKLAAVDAEIRQDPSRLRPAEQRRMLASITRIQEHTGWAPTISLETTLQNILDQFQDCTKK